MHLKDKLRKAFNSSASPSPIRDSHSPEQLVFRPAEPRWPSNVYRWDEPMPRLKYRGPVKIEHKRKLESYTLGSGNNTGTTLQRRRSHLSDHSPMSSRMQSRRSSIASQKKRNSIQGRRTSLRVRTSISAASVALGQQHTPPSAASPREHKRHMRESLFINSAAANSLSGSSASAMSSPFERDPNSPTCPLSPTRADPSNSPISSPHHHASVLRFSRQFQGEFIGAPLTPPKSPYRRTDLVVDTAFGTHHGNKSNVFRTQNPFASEKRESPQHVMLTPVTPVDGPGEVYAR